jgi:heat shock protein HtpX
VLVLFGWILTQSTGNYGFLVAFSAISLVTTAVAYWNSDKVALRAMNAQQVSPAQAPELHAMVTELASGFDMPPPRLYIAANETPNAFATGRNPKNSAVCCTTGIIGLLDARQLRGVLAHELSHVANRDVLTASVAAALANVVATAGQILALGGL